MKIINGLIKKISFVMFVSFITQSTVTHATESHDKLWGSAVVTGDFLQSDFRYYLQSDLRFINNPYIFNQLLLLAGLGYQFNSTMSLFFGYGYILDKNNSGDISHDNRLWQQFNWIVYNSDRFTLTNRQRLEANKNTQFSGVAYRLRERLWLRIPFKNWETHSFSLYDEVFLNINHPDWVSPSVFAQNRAFIGIGTQLSKSMILDVGYLNQYAHSTVNQLNHVLVLALTVNN